MLYIDSHSNTNNNSSVSPRVVISCAHMWLHLLMYISIVLFLCVFNKKTQEEKVGFD